MPQGNYGSDFQLSEEDSSYTIYFLKASMRFTIISGILGVAFLSACASSEPVVAPQAAPLPQMGYVGGNFTITQPIFVMAFILTNQQTQQQSIIPFTSKKKFAPGDTETNLVALPPGEYKLTHWTAYNMYWGPSAREFTEPVSVQLSQSTFKIEPGKVVFLGRFVGQSEWTSEGFRSRTQAGMLPKEISRSSAEALVRTAYPSFGSLAVECLLCTP